MKTFLMTSLAMTVSLASTAEIHAAQETFVRSETVHPIRNATFNREGAAKERRQGGNPR